MITIGLATIIGSIALIISILITFLIYRWDKDQDSKQLKGMIKTLEEMIKDREIMLSDLHVKMMAKDLTDYRVNTEPKSEYVQIEPDEIELEQATDDQFLKAIKESPVETTESVSQ